MSEMEEVGSMIKLVEQAVSLVDTVRKSLQKTGSDGHQDEIDKLFEAVDLLVQANQKTIKSIDVLTENQELAFEQYRMTDKALRQVCVVLRRLAPDEKIPLLPQTPAGIE